jgi:hypothetical protein
MPDRLAEMEVKQREDHLDVFFSRIAIRVHVATYPGQNARATRGMKHLAIYSGGERLFELTGQTSEDPNHAGQHRVTFMDPRSDPKIAWGICNAVLRHVDARCAEPKPPKPYLFAQQIFTESARADIAMLKEGRIHR